MGKVQSQSCPWSINVCETAQGFLAMHTLMCVLHKEISTSFTLQFVCLASQDTSVHLLAPSILIRISAWVCIFCLYRCLCFIISVPESTHPGFQMYMHLSSFVFCCPCAISHTHNVILYGMLLRIQVSLDIGILPRNLP